MENIKDVIIQYKNNNNSNNGKGQKDLNKIGNAPQKLITEFPKPPLIGLKNAGATCFMNATLQCFSHIGKLVTYFKYYDKQVNKVIIKNKVNNKICLARDFKILIENLWPSLDSNFLGKKYIGKNNNNSFFIPIVFKNHLSKMNSLFEGIHANNAGDLVLFIIMTLHEELNKGIRDKRLNSDLDPTNQKLIFNNFIQ